MSLGLSLFPSPCLSPSPSLSAAYLLGYHFSMLVKWPLTAPDPVSRTQWTKALSLPVPGLRSLEELQPCLACMPTPEWMGKGNSAGPGLGYRFDLNLGKREGKGDQPHADTSDMFPTVKRRLSNQIRGQNSIHLESFISIIFIMLSC